MAGSYTAPLHWRKAAWRRYARPLVVFAYQAGLVTPAPSDDLIQA